MNLLISNKLYRTLDAVITSSLRTQNGFWALTRSIASVRTSKYDRVRFLVNLLGMIFPGATIRSRKFLIRPENLPFKKSTIQPLGYGYGSTVYLLEEGKDLWLEYLTVA